MDKIVSRTVTEYEYDNSGRVSKETVTSEQWEEKSTRKMKVGYSNSVCDDRP